MRFYREDLQSCSGSSGLVIVIDVIRAFTTAGFAFAAGAESITLVGAVEEAFELRNHIPNSKVMGEVKGLPPPGFDFGNSPKELMGEDLTKTHLIQRTSAGTQGVVNSVNADCLLAASFPNAQATVDYAHKSRFDSITFVITGLGPDGRGEEDLACADYLESQISGKNTEADQYLKRVRECRTSQFMFADPAKTQFLWEDIELCTDINRFNFAMVIQKLNGRFVMKPVSPSQLP